MTIPSLTRRDVWARLTNERGRPLRDVSWTATFRDALDDPNVPLIIVSAKRQVGKTTHMMAGVGSTLFTKPGAYVLFISAAERQADAIFTRKLRRPIERLARDLGVDDLLRITNRTIEVPDLGTAFEFMAPNEATAPARSVDELYIDEARDVPDSVFEVLAPSVIGVGGKIIIGSTAGRPTGFFYELVKSPPAEACLIRVEGTENPEADPGVRAFLTRLYGLFPAAARRELGNEFTEGGEELIPAALIEVAVDDTLGELPSHPGEAFVVYDLSRRRDLTTRVVVVRVPGRRPEARDHLVVASIRAWDPRQSPTGETPFEEVRDDMASMPSRFPNVRKILVEEGAEAGAVLPYARQHPRLSLLVEGLVATPSSNMEMWSALVARLNARTLTIPRHERLLAELRGLRREEFAFGSRWRVVDGSKKYHRDVSFSLAGAVMAAGAVVGCAYCGDPACDGQPPLGLYGSAEVRAWFARHPDPDAPPREIEPPVAVVTAEQRAELQRVAGPWCEAVDQRDASGAVEAWRDVEAHLRDVEAGDPQVGAALRALAMKAKAQIEAQL